MRITGNRLPVVLERPITASRSLLVRRAEVLHLQVSHHATSCRRRQRLPVDRPGCSATRPSTSFAAASPTSPPRRRPEVRSSQSLNSASLRTVSLVLPRPLDTVHLPVPVAVRPPSPPSGRASPGGSAAPGSPSRCRRRCAAARSPSSSRRRTTPRTPSSACATTSGLSAARSFCSNGSFWMSNSSNFGFHFAPSATPAACTSLYRCAAGGERPVLLRHVAAVPLEEQRAVRPMRACRP